MKRTYYFQLFAISLLIMICATGCSGMAQIPADNGTEDSIKKSFDVSEGGTLTIESDRGSIEVHARSGSRIDIEVLRRVDERWSDDAEELLQDFEISFDQRGDDLYVTGKWKGREGRWWNRRRNRLKIKYIVHVPTRYNVDLETAGGSISVDDLEGEVSSRTSGGSLQFGTIKGNIMGRTSGGSISLEGCNGTAEVKTSGGSIRIGEVDGNINARTSGGSISIERAAGEVVAKTSGGSVHVEEVMGAIEATTSGGTIRARISRQPKGRCYLKTSGGSIKVYLAEHINADLDASTSGGHVETDFPIKVLGRISKRSLQGKINDGGPEMVLKTSGGSIYIRKL